MNSEQKKVLALLKEVRNICREQGITYYLSPQLTLCAITEQPFPENPGAGVILMKTEDMEKFRIAAEEKNSNRRFVESMNNSKRFPGFFLRYVDMDTLDFNLNAGRNYQHPGIGITIYPLRGKMTSRFRHLWSRAEEEGWKLLGDGNEGIRGKKKRLCKMFMEFQLLTGRARLGKSLYHQSCTRHKTEGTTEYILRMLKKTVYFPVETFEGTRKVKLQGEAFTAPENLDLYLSKCYGMDYLTKEVWEYKPVKSDVISAHISYEDYFQEIGSIREIVRDRKKARKQSQHGRRLKKYMEDSWKYAKFCGSRMRLEKYYLDRRDYIKNLYKNKDYPALERIFAPYTTAIVKSLKYNEIFAPDEELLEIFLGTLEKAGRTSLKDKIEKIWR